MDEALTTAGRLPKSPCEELPPVFPSSHLKTQTTCPAQTGCGSSLCPGATWRLHLTEKGLPQPVTKHHAAVDTWVRTHMPGCIQSPGDPGQMAPSITKGPYTGVKRTSTSLIWDPAWKSAETLQVHQGSQHGAH